MLPTLAPAPRALPPAPSATLRPLKTILLYSVAGGVFIALLKLLEYKHLAGVYPSEVYGGVIAMLFTVIGITLGLRWTRRKQPVETVVVREVEVRVREDAPFV